MSDPKMPQMRTFTSLFDVVTSYGCPACSQLTRPDHIYGSKYLNVCSKCAISVGPDAMGFIRKLSDDRLERRVQLAMMLAAAIDFAKALSNQESLAHNEDVCSLVRDMRDGLDLGLMPTTGTIQ